MSDMSDLKPCPFCGEEQPPHDGTSWVRCLGCGAESGWRATGAEAIEAWNTRIAPSDCIEELEAKLKKAVEALKFHNAAVELCIGEVTPAMKDAHKHTKRTIAELIGGEHE